jgi:hypothetical protein
MLPSTIGLFIHKENFFHGISGTKFRETIQITEHARTSYHLLKRLFGKCYVEVANKKEDSQLGRLANR